MKTKKIFATLLATALVATTVTAVSAAELTNLNPDGQTEVTAHISGEVGEVNYIITIPDKIDFGELVQPSEDVNSYKDMNFTVKATEMNIDEGSYVSVYVKDQNATVDAPEFNIVQKTTPYTAFEYDVYDEATIGEDTLSFTDSATMTENGYHLASFSSAGQELVGSLRINQKQLYGKDLATIAGDYSGYMIFHSAITGE